MQLSGNAMAFLLLLMNQLIAGTRSSSSARCRSAITAVSAMEGNANSISRIRRYEHAFYWRSRDYQLTSADRVPTGDECNDEHGRR